MVQCFQRCGIDNTDVRHGYLCLIRAAAVNTAFLCILKGA